LALALALVAAILMCWILSIEEAFRLAPLTGLAVFFALAAGIDPIPPHEPA
jgi:hypothetical protein